MHRDGKMVAIFAILLNSLFISESSAQTSKENHVGVWTDNTTWESGITPGVSGISTIVTINGFVTHHGNLNFSNGILNINDTLIIYGSIVFTNVTGGGSDPTPVDISIGSGGILIVFGDLKTGNKVDLNTKGKLAVTGQLTAQGGSRTEYSDVDGEIFLYNPPIVSGGGSFDPLQCPSPATSYNTGCNYGDSIDAGESTIAPLLESGGFSISPSGSITLSCGDSVELSTQNNGDLYSWYKDDVLLDEGNSRIIYASKAGIYYVKVTAGSKSYNTSSVSVNFNDIDAPTITCPSNINICEGETVELGTPLVTDDCAIDYVMNDAPLSYSIGETTVTWEAFDLSGKSSICVQTVTVNINPDSGELHRIPND